MKRFEVTHARHLHPPYGMWIVRHRGVEVGRQLSQPSADDCARMLAAHREGAKKLDFYEDRWIKEYGSRGVAALGRQRRGGRAKQAHHAMRRKPA